MGANTTFHLTDEQRSILYDRALRLLVGKTKAERTTVLSEMAVRIQAHGRPLDYVLYDQIVLADHALSSMEAERQRFAEMPTPEIGLLRPDWKTDSRVWKAVGVGGLAIVILWGIIVWLSQGKTGPAILLTFVVAYLTAPKLAIRAAWRQMKSE